MRTAVTDAPLKEVRWPRLTRCRHCHSDLLLARDETGVTHALDAWPIIVGDAACPTCRGRGRRGTPEETGRRHRKLTEEALTLCPKCHGVGTTGEPLTGEHVVMSHDGVLRELPTMVDPWDSAYRRHACEVTA